MSNAINPAAPHFLPSFITAPGETDPLLVGAVVFLILLVLILGSTYFWLHSIPERIAHGAGKIQFQLVAVMSLLALFTHNNAFWIGALLLALIPIPDFWTPLAGMAESLAKMAGRRLLGTPLDEPPLSAPEHSAIASSSPYAAPNGGVAAPADVATDGVAALENATPIPSGGAGSSRPHPLSQEGA